MVNICPTTKLRKLLPVSSLGGPESDTALGDWYVNRLVFDRRPLLLLVSSKSLLSILVPARDVRGLPHRVAEMVGQRLSRLGVERRLIDPELEAMAPLRLTKTSDRSVLGIMVDFAKMLPHVVGPGFSDHTDLMQAEEFLWDNPCFAGKADRDVIFPRRRAPELLEVRWNAG